MLLVESDAIDIFERVGRMCIMIFGTIFGCLLAAAMFYSTPILSWEIIVLSATIVVPLATLILWMFPVIFIINILRLKSGKSLIAI